MPARCTRCEFTFEGRGIVVGGNVQHLELSNNTETCPRCGGRAQIVEGTFNVRDGVLQALRATAQDRELLLRFAGIARQAREGSIGAEEAARQIATESPEIQRLLQRVPANGRKVLIWVLLHAIVILAAQGVSELRDESATPAEIERIEQRHDRVVQGDVQAAVERAMAESEQQHSRRTTTARATGASTTARNAPCPCGSGVKYKKCCRR